ncbi:adenylosuccinate lyase [Microbacterium sp. cx-55]|uniref:lyase family protein n=1 Tax=Microbacterium sp. cx-55 TaxID=2875948 RepID=UPI001CBC7590|nr:lyase family protein [Microbacterium sp. cx-55]MBZ4488345.1 adenylosuccinate lyase [Microbacterium sp. cx-55]UGB35000.1 adenylosuccinate lyase [Microbacterium sp. cx-55]
MPSDPIGALDEGLLSPVTVGADAEVSDAAILAALIEVEVALTRAWATVGTAPDAVAVAVADSLAVAGGITLARIVAASVAGGNPVIPLVGALKERVPLETRAWVHRGATSQDILDSALMLVSQRAGATVQTAMRETEQRLAVFAATHRDVAAAARTLTQHAVPTTVGARAAGWLRGVRRARIRLDETLAALPAQLGGAGGTLAAFVEIGGADAAAALPAAFAGELGLAVPDAPWHVQRWPVTELGDALVQAIDALGKLATDVATLSRTEIGELAEGAGGGSSAMPQKQNPAASVLIRSAALRAPQLAATLHLAAALAADERPDGAWHAEWPTLRELLRLALGATATGVSLVAGLRVDAAATARNLAATGGLVVAERLSLALTPLLGSDEVARIVRDAGRGSDLRALVAVALEAAVDRAPGATHPADGVDDLLDPAHYTGLAGELVDGAVRAAATTPPDPAHAAPVDDSGVLWRSYADEPAATHPGEPAGAPGSDAPTRGLPGRGLPVSGAPAPSTDVSPGSAAEAESAQ